MSRIAAVLGVGGGLGRAAALRFAREGFTIALVGRTAEKLIAVEQEIKSNGGKAASFANTDLSKPEDVVAVFAKIKADLGDTEVLIFNPSIEFKVKSILEITVQEMKAGIDLGLYGALVAAQQVLPAMIANKKGTIIFTGATASLRGGAKFSLISAPKFALRSLSQSLAREFGPQHVHVAHVVIDGVIEGPRTSGWQPASDLIKPEYIADEYWHIHTQHPTAWSQEVDLRPWNEKY